mmetsp:Transcript_22582/g.54048  ORF Transcript_22582/g.54048 Transcript_22582/m.54048 type:complete len:234 (+) Transcript_22582:735-1436(+)
MWCASLCRVHVFGPLSFLLSSRGKVLPDPGIHIRGSLDVGRAGARLRFLLVGVFGGGGHWPRGCKAFDLLREVLAAALELRCRDEFVRVPASASELGGFEQRVKALHLPQERHHRRVLAHSQWHTRCAAPGEDLERVGVPHDGCEAAGSLDAQHQAALKPLDYARDPRLPRQKRCRGRALPLPRSSPARGLGNAADALLQHPKRRLPHGGCGGPEACARPLVARLSRLRVLGL